MEQIKIVDKIKDKVQLKDHGKLVDLIDNALVGYQIGDDIALRSHAEGEFIEYILMSDQYFFDNWITQFAIGEVGGKNYFNAQAWSDLTEQFTKGVIVVHEETKQFLFKIPKFVKLQTSKEASVVLNNVCKIANNIKFQTDPAMKEQSMNTFSSVVTEIMDSDIPPPTITDLIPNEIYELCGISPKALKAVIYIRDYYKTITPNEPNFDKAAEILKNHFSGRLVSKKDKLFIKSLTNNDFYFDENEMAVNEIIDGNTDIQEDYSTSSFSPFSD